MACLVIDPGYAERHHRRLFDATTIHNHHLSQSKLRSGDDRGVGKNRFMYMLVRLFIRPGFVLYKIDPLHHLLHDPHNHHPNDLHPLLFFPCFDDSNYPHLHSCNCLHSFNCIKLGSKLYFFGLDPCFDSDIDKNKDESFTSVYTLEEKDLMCIQPSEHNDVNIFKHLFTKTKFPMHSPKFYPTLFVANQKLYVLSPDCSFEVFSPSDQTWQILPPSPFPKSSSYDVPFFVSEHQQMVFFCDYFFAFNLKTNTWTRTVDYSIFDSTSPFHDDAPLSPYPTPFFGKRVSLIGDTTFGFVYNTHDGYYICASQATSSSGKELIHPNLAPHQAFMEVLRSTHFSYTGNEHEHYSELYSDYIVALQDLDGKQVLCVVTHGNKAETRRCDYNNKISYVTLNFFNIPGDFYTLKDTPLQDPDLHSSYAYAEDTAEDGGVVRRYFNAEFRHAAHFVVSNSHYPADGQLEACFF